MDNDLDAGPAAAAAAVESAAVAEPVPLVEPRDGVPPVVADARALAATVAAFAGGSGPVAVDAERASGYRYGQRAYLVQLRRAGAGTALIDPVGCPDLRELNSALGDAEWVLHAASQDLPCLAGVGLVPGRIFDTELAGRLAGFARVGLGAIVENVLGYTLEKGHSAADWSQRPLPEPWLRYAALDVEVLVELRDALEAELRAQGKLEWAREEFAAVAAAPSPAPRPDRWRRTSGIHRLRTHRQLAALRELWTVREAVAQARDLAPGRLVPDAALIAAAAALPVGAEALRAVPGFSGRHTRRLVPQFAAALVTAATLAESDLPDTSAASDGPPPVQRWAERDAAAAARLGRVRPAVHELAEQLRMPTENLLSPDAVRRLAWAPPPEPDAASVAAALRATGARAWQVALTAEPLAAALTGPARDADGGAVTAHPPAG